MTIIRGFLFGICSLGYVLSVVAGELCYPNPCKNSAECNQISEDQVKCNCLHGWKGSYCEENVNDCNDNPCKNGGQCIDQKNSRYFCNCTNEYIGDQCQFINPCGIKNPCKNEGLCEPFTDGTFQCKCPERFIGELCEETVIQCPESIIERRGSCGNHGECQVDNNKEFSCKCDPGYTGKICNTELNYEVEMGCKDTYCSYGKCVIQNDGSPKCLCLNGEPCPKPQRRKERDFEHLVDNNIKETGRIKKYSKYEKSCPSKCKNLISNGVCDKQCNTLMCNYDGGDCDPWRKCMNKDLEHCRSSFNDGICNPECNNVDCLFDGSDCQKYSCPPHLQCPRVYQDNICNEQCNNPQCGFDGGDCQTRSLNSFFGGDSLSKCSSPNKIFELDLILMTTINNFTNQKKEFLHKLSSALKMVVTISNLSEIKFNKAKALLIKLYINHTQCILYGGQCFSTLDQISNFIKAGIERGNALSLPFRVAKVNTRIISTKKDIRTVPNYIMIIIIMGFALIISITLVGVLLRDKWGKLRTKIKTAGVWTPSDGYSTSTSSMNSVNKVGWTNFPYMKDFKKEYQIPHQFHYPENNYSIDQQKSIYEDNDKLHVNNRKRKLETVNRNDKTFSFKLISDSLEATDGTHPMDSNFTDIFDIINTKSRLKTEEKYQNLSLEGLGDYVNENGESLMHIAARMNSGSSLIKQLNAISPQMLHSVDEWGRTPLATSIASDSVESAEQLIILEKQLRKESKQNKSRSGLCSANSGVSYEYLSKKTTALIEAVKSNSKEMINLLLDEGNPVNILDTHGRSVVHWAAMFNNLALLERLSHMKIFQKLADLKDNEDKSPLYFAANEGALETVKFLVEYFNKNGIKIDPNCPCPKLIAEENNFHEIKDIISEGLRKSMFLEKNGKRIKLKDSKMRNKIPNFENPASNLCIIDEYKELSADSIEQFHHSSVGNESIDSCLMELYSINDPSIHNTQEISLCSSFKPMEHKCQGYQSNTSSSDMSPPLLNLNNPPFQNGFNPMTYSDPMDPNFSNTLFTCQTSFISQHDPGSIILNKNKIADPSSEFFNYQLSPTISDYTHSSINLSIFPPLNCL